jgi:alanyl-tRNA synthetase
MKTSEELRKDYIKYWTSEPRNAKEIPNVSLVPNNDPTLLFVNSGMFPVNPYLAGQPHPLGTRLVNFQRCLRTNYDDMLEIGDNRHTLMFEMIGVWSLGDFDKTSQIPWIMEFWVEVCGLDPKRLYVSVFEGNDDAPRDDEAIKVWKEAFAKYGVEAEFSEDITNIPSNLEEGEKWKYRIFPYPKKKNWWQRAADAPGELGGPTSEMFYDMGEIVEEEDHYHINDDSGRFIEIGNNVFMEYKFGEDRKWNPMEKKNIDFGGGFERVVMIVQNKKDIFETDIFEPILNITERLSGKSYKDNGKENEYTKYFRILADHSRAATFILGDGVVPSNKDQGYILRRFIRRLVRYGSKLGLDTNFTKDLAEAVINKLHPIYPHLLENKNIILDEIDKEETKFRKTLNNGLKIVQTLDKNNLTGEIIFNVYETYGFPLEMVLDELNIKDDAEVARIEKEFKEKEQKHREQSRAGAEQKFKGGLADQSVETTKLHTAHHLLLRALQLVVNENIKQRGSNITGERLRIDFSYDQKLTDEQIKHVEDMVNEKIQAGLEVKRVEMPKENAEKIGAQMEFGQKYPDTVSVYVIGGTAGTADLLPLQWFSAEFCGGPHVQNTSVIGEGGKKFKIISQENIGAGARRIKAVLQ